MENSAMETGSEIIIEAYRRLRNKVNSLNTRLIGLTFLDRLVL